MDMSLDLFEWAKKANRPRRRAPKPLGFYSALALVVKHGRLAEPAVRRETGGHPSVLRREDAEALPQPRRMHEATATCPRCGHVGSIARDFGARRIKGALRPQSWCRTCRATARAARRPAPQAGELVALMTM